MNCSKAKDTEEPEKDLVERLRIAKQTKDFDFVHVHTKAIDEASHKKNPELKKSVIESLDRAFLYALDEIVTDENILLVITSDHSTPSAGDMIHSGETVPLTMVGRDTRRDDVREFNEISCAEALWQVYDASFQDIRILYTLYWMSSLFSCYTYTPCQEAKL
ncbi:MAG: alkaline phosphatase [bacterium]